MDDRLMKVERVCALSDGVYAIALTLLVLDLKVPDVSGPGDSHLVEGLLSQSRNFVAYLISFALVARMWVKHHQVFSQIKLCDMRLLVLNFVHLLAVTLVPVASSLVGAYEDSRWAVILFVTNIAAMSFSLSAATQYASRHTALLAEAVRPDVFEKGVIFFRLTPIMCLISIALALWHGDLGLYAWFLLPPVLGWAARRIPPRRGGPRGAAGGSTG